MENHLFIREKQIREQSEHSLLLESFSLNFYRTT